MNTLLYRLSLIAMGAAIASLGLAANVLPSTASISLAPGSYVTLSGADGGQPASNLATMTESGTLDHWNAYVEYQTYSGAPYSGYQVFTLPSNLSASAIDSMGLQVNFRGPLSSFQVWKWSIYDWAATSWVEVGTNAIAQDWVWTQMAFNIPSPYARYVNANNKLRIRLKSNNAADNADIDYEAVSVGYSTAATPASSATPTTAPILTSTSAPLATPTAVPMSTSTSVPSATPTTVPTSISTSIPSPTPTKTPAPTATLAPTNTPSASSWWKPGLNTSWQIQYVGAIDTSLDVQVYNLDGFDTPSTMIDLLHLRGIKVMCYFSAGTWEDWRPDASSFPGSVLGNSVAGWPGENWLDIRQVNILLPLMEARMDMCKSKGFDGIDPDNIDGYTNGTGFPLTGQDQKAYNIALSNAAHARGLAIGLKNDIDQVPALVSYFDWIVNEQCFEYNECDTLLPFIQAGKPVFNIEYGLATSAFCPQANSMNFNSLKKKLSLDAYRVACR